MTEIGTSTKTQTSRQAPRIDRRVKSKEVEKAGLASGLTRLQSHILAGRLESADGIHAFLNPTGESLDHYSKLAGAEKAISRIVSLIRDGSRIACFSDYDTDGLGGNACFRECMISGFGHPAANTLSYVGNRLTDGYGLTDNAVDSLLAEDDPPEVVITVDCGSADEARIQRLKEAGVDVIVTDHHHIPGNGPTSAYAFVNPQRADCEYPDKAVAGGMVVWLILWGVREALRAKNIPIPDPRALGRTLDYVACSTVADCVSLASTNNRAIVRHGLRMMNEFPRACWRALGPFLKQTPIDASTIGYEIAARINARTRLDEPLAALSFLTADDDRVATTFAKLLDEENNKRKEIEKALKAEARTLAVPMVNGGAFSICVYLPNGHAGVQGICASRLVEEFGRPTFIFSPSNEEGLITGSARSIPGLDIKAVLDDVNEATEGVVARYGGHAAAAGATVRKVEIDSFRQALETAVRARIDESTLGPSVMTDGTLNDAEMSLQTVDDIAALGPYGRGFEQPVFDGLFDIVSCKPVGDGTHLQLTLMSGQDAVRGIWFRAIEAAGDALPVENGSRARLLFELRANTFRGSTRLQVLVRSRIG